MKDRDSDLLAGLDARVSECRKKVDLYGENAALDCIESERKFHKTNNLLKAISRAHSQFIANVDTRVLFG